MKVHYSEEAEQDLVEIGLYTWTEWGEEQYLKYMALLRDACEDIIPANVAWLVAFQASRTCDAGAASST